MSQGNGGAGNRQAPRPFMRSFGRLRAQVTGGEPKRGRGHDPVPAASSQFMTTLPADPGSASGHAMLMEDQRKSRAV
jgi:hypothetical protein